MENTTIDNNSDQITMELGEDFAPNEIWVKADKPKKSKTKTKVKKFEVGTKIAVNPETKLFCDGRGIPDYARVAYVKHINYASETLLIGGESNGKTYGLLFMEDVTVM